MRAGAYGRPGEVGFPFAEEGVAGDPRGADPSGGRGVLAAAAGALDGAVWDPC